MPKYFFPLLILSLIALCVEVDMSAPSFPDMARYFAADEGTIQRTISYNFLGFFLASLFYGPLSDAWGRRPLMLAGNLLLSLGAIACVIAPTIDFLLVARFLQGVGGGASAVLVFAIMGDVYKDQEMVSKGAIMNALLTGLMAIAPVIGSFVNQAVSWRGNYAVVAALCLLSLLALLWKLPETNLKKKPVKAKTIAQDFKSLLCSWRFLKMALVPTVLCAGYFCFIASASFLYTEVFNVTIYAYAAHQAAVVGMFSISSISAGRLMKRWGSPRALRRGIWGAVLGGVWLLIVSLCFKTNATLFTLGMVIFAAGFALVYPIVFAASLQVFPAIGGTASALIMSLRGLFITVGVAAGSIAYSDSAISVAWVIGVTILLGAVLTITFFKDPLFKTPVVGAEGQVHF